MGELHGELAAAGGHGAEVADVAEHGGERSLGLDANAAGGGLLALDHAAAAVEVADDVAVKCYSEAVALESSRPIASKRDYESSEKNSFSQY